MKETGLWRLFFLTGSPQVYLQLKREQRLAAQQTRQARSAFAREPKDGKMV